MDEGKIVPYKDTVRGVAFQVRFAQWDRSSQSVSRLQVEGLLSEGDMPQ